MASSVLVVGPRLMQEAFAALLARHSAVEAIATASMQEAVGTAKRLTPEVVLMELPAQSRGTVRILRALANLRRPPHVIVVVGDACTRSDVTTAIDAGAHACVSYDGGSEQLVDALDAVRNGERYLGPMVARLIMAAAGTAQAGPHTPGDVAERLTARERQVLALIGQGKTEREIARELGLSPKTVHTHRTSIMSKLRVHNVIALVRRALQLGLVDI